MSDRQRDLAVCFKVRFTDVEQTAFWDYRHVFTHAPGGVDCAICLAPLPEAADVACVNCRDRHQLPAQGGARLDAAIAEAIRFERDLDGVRDEYRFDAPADVEAESDWTPDLDLVIRAQRTPLGRGANAWRYAISP